MNRHAIRAFAASLLCATTTMAAAQSVYRCDTDGRVVYQGEPCRGGRAVDTAAARPAADEAEAARIAQRQMALADRLADERRTRERQAVAPVAGILHTKTELSPSTKPRLRTKHQTALDADVQTWRARLPASPRKPG